MFATADQAIDLVAVHQEAARPRRIGVHVRRGLRERCNVRADERDLGVLDHDVRFLEVGAPGADRLDLPAFERHPGLDAFLDKIVVERLPVLDDAHQAIVAAPR